jgi:uncharacterized protein
MRFRSLFLVALLFFCRGVSQAQRTILWKISKAGGSQVSYLLGTFHYLSESFVDSLPVIRDKLLQADLFVSEAEFDRKEMIAYYNARASSDSLSLVVSREDEKFIRDMYKDRPVDLSKYAPGELLLKISLDYYTIGCVPQAGKDKYTFDEYLQLMAKEGNKATYFFEEAAMEHQLIYDQTRTMDWNYFQKHIGSVLQLYRSSHPPAGFCKMAWDFEAFDIAYDFGKKCKDLAVVENRNADWMKKLPGLLEQHNCFIDVGIQHLCNKCGLIVQLRDLGYTVEPVVMK